MSKKKQSQKKKPVPFFVKDQGPKKLVVQTGIQAGGLRQERSSKL